MIHDLGIVAVQGVEPDGTRRFGFKVLAGGGPGHKPHQAVPLESFIQEHELLIALEAGGTPHNKKPNPTPRAQTRSKNLLDKFGAEGFIQRYREEFARIKEALGQREFPPAEWRAGAEGHPPGPGAPRTLWPQKQEGLSVLPLALPIGNLTTAQMRGI